MKNGVTVAKNRLIGAVARNKKKGVRQLFVSELVDQASCGESSYLTQALYDLECEGVIVVSGLKVVLK